MSESHFEAIAVGRHGRVLTLTMNRPEALNAVDDALHADLARVFRFAARDEGSDVVVLTGAGRAFSAGGDMDWLAAGAEDPAKFEHVAQDGKQIVFSLLDLEKPIIAKVNGPAVGLGATLALFCDVIFMADDAVIADPHVKVGLVAGDGGAIIWPQLIGYARAKHYLMTGDPVRAEEALAIGLVNFVLPAAELDRAVEDYADRLAIGAGKAIRWTKTSVNVGLKQLAHAILDTSIAYEIVSNSSADHAEGVRAFVEKRKPRFTGA